MEMLSQYCRDRTNKMNVIYAEYTHHNSIDTAATTGYLLRIDCWEAEKGLKTTPGSECALNTLAIDAPLNMPAFTLRVICRYGWMRRIL